jgi:AcrR family transcriptional regulator
VDKGPRDTRRQIQEVALELFTERGYETTSLREVAERLGVTKAALYYHFKTKEDIVASLVAERLAEMDALIAWVAGQPRTAETRRELLERYCDDLYRSKQHLIVRFFERNQAAMHALPIVAQLRERMLTLLDGLTDPADPPAVRLRRSLAIFAIHGSWLILRDQAMTDDDRRKTGLQVALELADTT